MPAFPRQYGNSKRSSVPHSLWRDSCEALELRQMLSASHAPIEPTAAIVVPKLQVPNVNGTWNVTFGDNNLGLTTGSLSIHQHHSKLNATFHAGTVGKGNLHGTITNNGLDSSSATMSGTIKTPNGPVKVEVNVTFLAGTNMFHGTATLGNLGQVEISGTKG
jgi:hypothetical protein